MTFLITEVVYIVLCLIAVAVGDFLPASVLMAMIGLLAVLAAPIFAVLTAMGVSNESNAPLKWWGVAGYSILFLAVNWIGVGIVRFLI